MAERQKQYEILNFKQTLARLNQNIRVDEVTSLDKHIIDAFNGMSDLAKISILMSCCLINKDNCLADSAQTWKPADLVDSKFTKTVETKEELGGIEKANQMELIRLKTWAMKMMLTVMSGLVLIGAGTALISAKDPSGFIFKNMEWMLKVLEVVFF